MATTSLQKQIAQNHRNTKLIILVFILMMAAIGGIFAWLNSDPKMVLYFVAVSALYAGIQYFLADKLAIKSAGAVEIQPSDNPRLYNIVASLASEAKIPMPKVYIVNDAAPNAFATGRDPAHACVAATTGILEIMDDKELRAVMAHEMSHVKNYDIRVTMIVFGLVSLAGLLSDFGMRVMFYGGGRDDEDNSPIGILIAGAVLILSPIIATLIQLGVSRQREYLADASSVDLTHSPDDMIAALRKLDSHAQPMHQQNLAAESLYISNPLRKSMFSTLFSTHPSIESRIERLENAKK
ncbi:M48 family metalloprotease [Candidatus Saccharibacteria bacterium]|nr:M48 family metalloprotease [Candidatus Saccharibacteria bacterium]